MTQQPESDKQNDHDQHHSLQRVQAIILYADVANYSGLCAADEDRTLRSVERYLSFFADMVAEQQGTVHHYAGDAILATFERAESAIDCGLQVQRRFREWNREIESGRRIEFRIGINQGQVVPRRGDVFGDDVNIAARLESLAVPGGICISDSVRQALEPHASNLRVTYLGERRLKNIPRSVAAYLVELKDDGAEEGTSLRTRTGSWLQLPRRPSLAVLPFRYLGEDQETREFTDGLSMEIMTELVKLSGLFLASDFSTLRYRREKPSAQAVYRDLGVRYLLEGTVRRAGNRIRVNVQLSDAKNCVKVWAERYDETLDEVFEIQDSITDSIIAALDLKLVSGERSQLIRKSLKNREALRRYYKGWSHLIAGTREDLMLAQNEFERSARLEPSSPFPLAMASWTHWWQGFRVMSTDSQQAFAKAEYFAEKALALEDPNGFSDMVMAHVHLLHKRHHQALESALRALKKRPSCDVSAAAVANVLNYLNRSDESITYAEQAIRLTPIAPTIYPGILASSYYGAGRYADAVAAAHAVIELNPDAFDAWMVVVAAEIALNNPSAAKAARDEILRLKPAFSLAGYIATQPYTQHAPIQLLEDRLSLAGLQ